MKESRVLSIPNPRKNAAWSVNYKATTTKVQLEAELADAKLLHRLSAELIQEDGIAGLYEKIVQAAVSIMRSQFGTIQMLYPHDEGIGKLRILACSGFTPEAEKYWEWVYPTTGSTCGEVLRTGKRVIVSDYRTCEFMQGEPTLAIFLEGGILAAQSTPLFSRTGKLVGMISTHWSHAYNPPQAQLELLEILARQASDLIERTQTQQALKESEERLRALATATNEVIFRMSADWTQIQIIAGKSVLTHTGKPDENWLDNYVAAEDRPMIKAAIQNAIHTKSICEIEYRAVKNDGSTGWIFSRAIPIIDGDGHISEWYGTASDVTAQKTVLTQLEGMVNERTKELQRSNEDLLQFAHVANHDLKEPVRKIKTFGQMAKDEIGADAGEKMNLYINKVLASADRMTTMIDGVLTYSSLNALEEKRTTVDLNNILADICSDLEVIINNKQADIQYHQLPKVAGVEVLIYQLFYNLINNSLKFSKTSEKPLISITAHEGTTNGTPCHIITLTDNGIGFHADHNEKIFETFTRLNSKDQYDGTGLGLSLSRKIVERHGGTIRASGNYGVGAQFTITLPTQQR